MRYDGKCLAEWMITRQYDMEAEKVAEIIIAVGASKDPLPAIM